MRSRVRAPQWKLLHGVVSLGTHFASDVDTGEECGCGAGCGDGSGGNGTEDGERQGEDNTGGHDYSLLGGFYYKECFFREAKMRTRGCGFSLQNMTTWRS